MQAVGPYSCDAVADCDRMPEYKHSCGKICRAHYRRWNKYGSFDIPVREKGEWYTCSIDGCENKSRTINGKYCEKHYVRHYRTGSFDDPERGRECFTSNGYVAVYSPLHEIAGKTGVLYKHRKVLYDRIGGGVHPCHWCGKEVEWCVK